MRAKTSLQRKVRNKNELDLDSNRNLFKVGFCSDQIDQRAYYLKEIDGYGKKGA